MHGEFVKTMAASYYPRYRTAQFKTKATAQLTATEQFNLAFLKPRFLG
jgi:hypothetical protein